MISKKAILITVVSIVLTSCATSAVPVASDAYSADDLATVMSLQFDAKPGELKRALAPSFAKFGAPKAYVSGLMSLPAGEGDKRLLGTGEHHIKYKRPAYTFWELKGSGFAAIERPMNAMHLLYDKPYLDEAHNDYIAMTPEYRRGATFTVFEREIDGRVVVTVYRTADMPKQATLNALHFTPMRSQSGLGLFNP